MNYESKETKEYKTQCEGLKKTFPEGYSFLKSLVNYSSGIYLQTAKNAHLYSKNRYLSYIKLLPSEGKIEFHKNYHGNIGNAEDKHDLIWPNLLNDIIKKDENYSNWASLSNDSITVNNKAPQVFFEDFKKLLSEINGSEYSEPLLKKAEIIESQLIDEPTEKQDEDIKFPLNLILYGPPGTGKTFHTINYALAMIEGKSIEDIDSEEREELLVRFNELKQKGQIEFITFHQSYSYEDFIQGIRPDVNNTGGLSFELKDGLFKKIADRALTNYQDNEEHNNYVIIIDEINRANISRVFGELITLIEKDKRYDGSNALWVTLPSGPSDKSFTVSPNLYILGTVNTADKSIALLDLALRRRFEFIKMYPVPDLVIPKYKGLFEELNKEIVNRKGPDFQIGHSYFMADEDKYFNLKDTMNRKIIPLLYEYFMNDGETVNKILISAGIKTTSIMGLYEFESYSG